MRPKFTDILKKNITETIDFSAALADGKVYFNDLLIQDSEQLVPSTSFRAIINLETRTGTQEVFWALFLAL